MVARTKYLAAQEFVTRLGATEADGLLGQGGRDNRTLDLDRAATVLLAADNLIDGYVSARYKIGFAKIPDLLKDIAFDIARYKLRGQGGQSSNMSEVVRQRYEDAIAQLKDISNGRMTLDSNGDGSQPEPDTHAQTVKGYMPESRINKALEGWS